MGASVIEIPLKNGNTLFEILNTATRAPVLLIMTGLIGLFILRYKCSKQEKLGTGIQRKQFVQREALKIAFSVYMVLLAKITIIPSFVFYEADPYIFSEDTFVIYLGFGLSTVNFTPFQSILNAFEYGFFYGIYHNAGNILMFVPFGFLFMAVSHKPMIRKTVLWAALISCIIETIQFFEPRAVDVDDVLLNTTGAAVGALIYQLIVAKTAMRASVED